MYKKIVAGVVLAVSVAVLYPGIGSAVAATSPFSANVQGNNAIQINQTNAYAVAITDTGGAAGDVIVDFEIHDASGAKVYQQFYGGQNFSAGQAQSYNFSWTPAAAGNYSLSVGVFTAGWANMLFWKDGIATVSGPAVPLAHSLANANFYVDPNSSAAVQAKLWQYADPVGAARMALMAAQPEALWFGGWNSNVTADVNALVSTAQAAGTTPVLVAYNIPNRDCGGYSAGGAQTPSAYRSWIQSFAQGIGARAALVILEPDALASIDCLSSADQSARLGMLSYAVQTLKSLGQTKVYLDAGNANWVSVSAMAPRLQSAGVAAADGFSLNVSNFYTTAANTQYGNALSALVGGKHFVIDTGRNGNGSDGQWCNPSGRALGALPTANASVIGNAQTDALLWIKQPGESDGYCNGGPGAGAWWPQYAAGLAAAAGY